MVTEDKVQAMLEKTSREAELLEEDMHIKYRRQLLIAASSRLKTLREILDEPVETYETQLRDHIAAGRQEETKQQKLDNLLADIYSCTACPLHKYTRRDLHIPVDARVLIVMDCKPTTEAVGTIANIASAAGLHEKEFGIVPALKCTSDGKVEHTVSHLMFCAVNTQRIIQTVKPEYVWSFGKLSRLQLSTGEDDEPKTPISTFLDTIVLSFPSMTDILSSKDSEVRLAKKRTWDRIKMYFLQKPKNTK
jgi:chaperonin cofactor prefoldin